jgi:hypothetical protein
VQRVQRGLQLGSSWPRLPVAVRSLDWSLQTRGVRRGLGLRALEFRQLGKRRAWQGLVAISTRGTPPGAYLPRDSGH